MCCIYELMSIYIYIYMYLTIPDFKGWNPHVHRGSPGKCESTRIVVGVILVGRSGVHLCVCTCGLRRLSRLERSRHRGVGISFGALSDF